MGRAIWIGISLILCVTIVALVVALNWPSGAALIGGPQVDDARLAALEQRVELLQRHLLLQQTVSNNEVKVIDVAPQPATTSSSHNVNAVDEVESQTAEQQQISYEQRFKEADRSNTSWSSLKEGELSRLTMGASLARLRSNQCRGAMCRIEIEHSSKKEAEEFLDENEHAPALLGTTYYRFPIDETGTRFVMFIEPAQTN